MKKTPKECCEWRERVELALEKGDKPLLDETMWHWYRFSEKGENGLFNCFFCYQKITEWAKTFNINLNDRNSLEEKGKNDIKTGAIKCCEIVRLIDLNDPDKSILHQWAFAFKSQFQEKLCFECSVKLNGILTTLAISYPKS